MTDNKQQAPRKMPRLTACLKEVETLCEREKLKLSDYQKLDIAVRIQANDIRWAEGDYDDEHAYFRTNALLGIRDALSEGATQMNELQHSLSYISDKFAAWVNDATTEAE